jgi:hypothetical protein
MVMGLLCRFEAAHARESSIVDVGASRYSGGRRAAQESKAAAAAFLDADAGAALVEPLAQQYQSGVKILGEFGQPERPVEAQFAGGEVGAAALGIFAHQPPQDGASHALDQVIVVEEDAVVARVVPHRYGRVVRSVVQLRRLGLRDDILGRQQHDERAEVRGDEGEGVLVVIAEPHRLLALGKQHTQHPPAAKDRYGDLARRRGEAGEGNLGRLAFVHAVLPRILAHRRAVAIFGGHVSDADRRALARRHADDAFADRHFRADAGARITARGQRVEPMRVGIEHQRHAVSDAEAAVEAVEREVQELVEFAGA